MLPRLWTPRSWPRSPGPRRTGVNEPDPTITVMALNNPDSAVRSPRAVFSDTTLALRAGPHLPAGVAAPGVGIWSPVTTPPPPAVQRAPGVNANGVSYCSLNGTSMAAPHVTGLISYLLAYAPSLTVEQAKRAVLAFASPDAVSGAVTPALDAFASLMSLPGAARDLVDLSDGSKDGNQRVVINQSGTQTEVVKRRRTPGPCPMVEWI